MRKLSIIICAAILCAACAQAFAQTAQPAAASKQAGAQQGRVIGEVTAIDVAGKKVSIKLDGGDSVTVSLDESTAYLRLAPGETSLDKAATITLADIAVGDRVLARGATRGGEVSPVKQLIVVSKTAVANAQERGREDFRQRGVAGRISAINADKREITVLARSREGALQVTIAATDKTRFMRYAPDSMKLSDAAQSSFAELKVGDQIRALGEKSADGLHVAAEEVIAGSFVRTGGTVTAVNTAANEVTIKSAQTGQTINVRIGKRSSLRRVTPEMAAAFQQRRAERAAGQGGPANVQGERRRREPTESGGANPGADGGRGPRGGGGGSGGRNFQDAFENLPAVTLGELKKGDTVFVTGSSNGADASTVTAITILTGDEAFLNRLMQGQGNRNPRGMNPGLPGDVLGGGTVNRDQP